MAFGSFLRKLKNVVAPVIGTAVAGPLGGVVAGGLANAFDEGDRFQNILKGAGTAAAGIGVSKGLSALKGAMTGAGSATEAVTRGATEPTALLAKGKEFIPTQAITPPAVKALAPAVEGSASVGANAARIAGGAGASASAAGTAAPASGFRYTMIGGDRGQFLDALPPEARQTAQGLYDLSNRARAASRLADAGGGATNTTSRLADMSEITPPSSGLTSRTLSRPVVSTPSTPTPIGNGRIMDRLRELLSGVGGFAKENPEVAMGIAQGLGSAFSTSPQEREIEYMRELAAARARMLAPLYAQYSREFMG